MMSANQIIRAKNHHCQLCYDYCQKGTLLNHWIWEDRVNEEFQSTFSAMLYVKVLLGSNICFRCIEMYWQMYWEDTLQ